VQLFKEEKRIHRLESRGNKMPRHTSTTLRGSKKPKMTKAPKKAKGKKK